MQPERAAAAAIRSPCLFVFLFESRLFHLEPIRCLSSRAGMNYASILCTCRSFTSHAPSKMCFVVFSFLNPESHLLLRCTFGTRRVRHRSHDDTLMNREDKNDLFFTNVDATREVLFPTVSLSHFILTPLASLSVSGFGSRVFLQGFRAQSQGESWLAKCLQSSLPCQQGQTTALCFPGLNIPTTPFPFFEILHPWSTSSADSFACLCPKF